MNSKIFTFSTLLLFFLVNVNAQTNQAPLNNIVGIVFSVEDDITNGAQKFLLVSQEEYLVDSGANILFKLNLDYQSNQSITSYFGLQYKIYKLSESGTIEYLTLGITKPVIIPPVRKKRTRLEGASEEYPFLIHTKSTLEAANYLVKLNLVKYHSREDYLAENLSYDPLPKISFQLNAISNEATINSTATNYTIAYQQSNTDHVIIENPIVSTENRPLAVTIFNDKGIKISHHLLPGVSKNNSKWYSLDISQLPKGMYFYQLNDGTKTVTKTVLKK